ncbi:MAG TPA: ATP-dependent metallopeptidase FtsH/Yme1/Tma family protein [Candidatus Dormibacteraeota bacterium]|nr:ATP-dependent metallopeptidase FtsH/Yme1/Tma family protein [Candidatus Dormibacteraeota bacterium]
MISLFKRALFVLCLLFLVVMVWRLVTASHDPQGKLSYPEFMQALEAGKIQQATIYMGTDLADIQVNTRNSSRVFLNDVPTKDLPTLIKKMMDAGVSVEFSRARRSDWAEFVLNISPIALLGAAIAYIFYSRRRVKV